MTAVKTATSNRNKEKKKKAFDPDRRVKATMTAQMISVPTVEIEINRKPSMRKSYTASTVAAIANA